MIHYGTFWVPQKFKHYPATGHSDVYFIMSTGEPYTVLLMKAGVSTQ